MIFDKYFMLVPVYRISEDEYYSQMKSDFEKEISKTWDSEFQIKNPDLVDGRRRHHRSAYGGDWEFNEIVGYIKLFFMGSQVRGEYWSTEPKRKVRTRNKKYELKAIKLVSESEIWEKTNDGILSAVEDYLERSKKELKGRHVDFREFNSLKSHINWVSVHKAKNVFS